MISVVVPVFNEEENKGGRSDMGIFPIEVSNNKLMFLDLRRWIDVESVGNWKIETTYGQIKRLCNILRLLDEQPIVVLFKDSNNRIQLLDFVI